MEKTYKMPAVCWLKVTDYMHGWIEYELGGAARVKDHRVVCIQHLTGAREYLRMETEEEATGHGPVGNSLSATWYNCIDAGLRLDEKTIEHTYGITREGLKLYMPIECPANCLTKNGVLRPWSLDVNFGKRQGTSIQRLLRDAFWKAVEDFAEGFAREHQGKRYAQVEMIEAFCSETQTPDLYVDAMRREWQRRCKRISDEGSDL